MGNVGRLAACWQNKQVKANLNVSGQQQVLTTLHQDRVTCCCVGLPTVTIVFSVVLSCGGAHGLYVHLQDAHAVYRIILCLVMWGAGTMSRVYQGQQCKPSKLYQADVRHNCVFCSFVLWWCTWPICTPTRCSCCLSDHFVSRDVGSRYYEQGVSRTTV